MTAPSQSQSTRVSKDEIRAGMMGPPAVQRLSALPVVGPFIRDGYRRWYRWNYLRAFAPEVERARAVHRQANTALSDTQRRLLADLTAHGYAWATFAELWPDVDYAAVRNEVIRWTQSPEVLAHEAAYRSGAANKGKAYISRMYDRDAVIEPNDRWLALGLSPAMLAVVNHYLGMASRLTYFDVWNTVARVHDGPDRGSQRWHRDPEDTRLVKAFLYFTDVDEHNGAMEYVTRSRAGERYGKLWPQEFPAGSFPPDEELERTIDPADRVLCAAPQGRVLLADTTGFHRGGRATARNRVLATWMYVTPRSVWPRAFTLRATPEPLSALQRFAATA